MAKEKQPLLSLEAHGTIADTLTYQRSKGQNIARTKPRLPYFLTLPVQYQRWLYEDYAYLWRQQTAATQKTYRADGVRHHLTGFQYWMKYQLTNLPDIAGMWYLDVPTGATTPDASRNENTGTIIGASPATGLIDGCLSFDGINDLVDCGNAPSLNMDDIFTIETFVQLHRLAGWEYFIANGRAWISGWWLQKDHNTTNVRFASVSNLGNQQIIFAALVLDTWAHLAFVFDEGDYRSYVDGVPGPAGAWAGDRIINPAGFNFGIGAGVPLVNATKCSVDHTILYNRGLDATEILRHSLRRWPP